MEIEIFCNIIHVYIFDQINASSLNNIINIYSCKVVLSGFSVLLWSC